MTLTMNPNAQLIDTMRTLTFGVEIETVGATREALAAAVASALPGSRIDGHAVVLPDGRRWTVVLDGSLTTGANGEVVTPICTWADLEPVQAVVRALRTHAHARTDDSCGVHVHIGVPADRFDAAALGRLAKLVYQQEPLIVAALGVAPGRAARYAKSVDDSFMARIAASRPRSRDALATSWYGQGDTAAWARGRHYHDSRYHGLNLHSVFYRGTVEFRYFQGTLHAGQVKAWVLLCLALATKALTSKGAMARKRTFDPATSKYDFRVFLLRLGMIGPEFKVARFHLMARLEGSSSRKGRPVPPKPPQDAIAAPPAA